MFASITAADLSRFRDGSGNAFTQFVDGVIRAAAARLMIQPTDVHTNVRVNVRDGGVDTQVNTGADDPAGRLTQPTLWQYKAQEFSAIDDAAIEHEINAESKEYARSLISKGYAYRLCVCHDTATNIKLRLQAKLNDVVKSLNSAAPPALVLGASDIAEWANQYPSVVAKTLGLPTDNFRWFDSWQISAVADTREFVATDQFPSLRDRIQAHLDWSTKPKQMGLTVYGDAGVGKTRSVFEILKGLENQRELVLYTIDEQAAKDIATLLVNESSKSAILVSDECLAPTKYRLEQILAGTEMRVRLITIDNAQERRRTLAPELEVERLSDAETERILAANFESVIPSQRHRYAAICRGFLRLAIYMCAHDGEIQGTRSLGAALEDAASYYESRFFTGSGFDARDREALELVAMVDRLGYREDVAGQLDALCSIVGKDPIDTRTRLERLRQVTGFVANAGRFYYVTPSIIAMLAFESGWRRWAEPDPYRFLSAIPEDLIEAFHSRVSSASAEVGAVVARFFREWTLSKGTRVFESEPDTRRLLALVEADPATQVPLLRMLVESAEPRQFETNDWTNWGSSPRRLVIYTVEQMAQFSEFFRDAEAILLKLAKHEAEPSIGNNATNTWKALFRILLSGSELPFSERFSVLEDRFAGNDPQLKSLVIDAAAGALDLHGTRMMGPPLFGNRIPPQEWKPKTWGEYFDAIKQCIGLLLAGASSDRKSLAKRAQDALLDSASQLLHAGYSEPVRGSAARTYSRRSST